MNLAQRQRFQARVQQTLEALFPATITLSLAPLVQLAATTGGLRHAAALQMGGILDDDAIVFRVRKSLLATEPNLGQRVSWVERNLTFRLQRVSDPGDADPVWVLGCQAIAK